MFTPMPNSYPSLDRVYTHAPLIRSRQEMDEIDYISDIAIDLMEKDPEDRRPKD